VGHVSLIIKATRLCNLRCDYCHDWAAGPGNTMGFPVLLALTRAALEDPTHDYVEFIWHGGETTVLQRTFYQRAVLLQQRLRRPRQVVHNVIQTNATRLDAAWVRFFRDYEFRVGISLDGPREVHDAHRRYRSGRPSFDDVMRGIALLRDGGVPFTVLMVVGDEALSLGPEAVFETFEHLGVKEYGLIEVKPENQPDAQPATPTENYLSPNRMGPFLAAYYDHWRTYGDRRIKVRELRAIENRVRHVDPGICKLGGPCLGDYFLVEPDGEIAHCDLFKGDPAYTLGSVLDSSFAELRRSPALERLKTADAQARREMSSCPEFATCQGWCPHERYLGRRHDPRYSAGCCGLRPLIEHVRDRLAEDAPGVVAEPA
jgi:uncharacterized protein